MPDDKKPKAKSSARELREVLIAYESAMAPVILPLVLGFIGYLVCTFFKVSVLYGIFTGLILGFIVGLKRLLVFIKKTNQKDSINKKEIQKKITKSKTQNTKDSQ